jgi:hypothetical protein
MPIFNRHDASAGCRRGLARSEGEDAPILRRPDRGVTFGVCPQSAAPACSLYASFTRRRGNRDEAKTSSWSAMFIATDATGSAKLQRSGMVSR